MVYLVLHLLLDGFSAVRPAFGIGVTPWNPATALALVYMTGWRGLSAPFVLAANLVAAATLHAHGVELSTLVVAAAIETASYYGLARLLRQGVTAPRRNEVTQATVFLAAAAAAALLSATLTMGWFASRGQLAAIDLAPAVLRQAFADLNAVLVVVPMMLPLPAGEWPRSRTWKSTAIQSGAVIGALFVLFALPEANQLRYFYLLFLPIVWLGLKWGAQGALTGVCVAQITLVIAARLDVHAPRFVDLQVFMFALAATALLLGAVVAERQRIAEQLRERDASLARAMQFAVAGEMASALSHELSQPVSATIAYLETARTQATDTSADHASLVATLGKAAAAARKTGDVLTGLRDFYRGAEARRDRVDLVQTCSNAAQGFSDSLRASRIRLDLQAPGPAWVASDERQLDIVLQNLLTNARDALDSASPASRRILLRVDCHASMAEIRCEDSGPGIPAEQVATVFEPFATSKAEGMGLGLAISRKLVRSMGGEMTYARSEALGGAAFIIRLPLLKS